MSTRSAEHTLLGFYYQFDKSIFVILNQKDKNTKVTIEGVEDIDINSTTGNIAIQVKYQELTDGTDSTFRKPISLMLKHFAENQNKDYKYVLYGHYKNNSEIDTKIDFDRLKEMMNYKKKDTKTKKMISYTLLKDFNIDEKYLNPFLSKLDFILGDSFLEHQNKTLLKIKSEFNTNTDEESMSYYSNALKVVNDLAIKDIEDNRKITKKEFMLKIDLKNILFNSWFIELKGKKEYSKLIYSKYFRNTLNSINYERIFILNTANNEIENLKNIIFTIEDKFYKKTNRGINSGAPYIFINNISVEELINLKESIYADGKTIHDGFCFVGSSFKCKEIRKPSTLENSISIKIINKRIHLDEILSNINGSKKLFEFYDTHTESISNDEDYISKIQIENLTDISQIIKGR